MHTAKALLAAADISRLVRLPTALVKHTHFFTCAIAMAAVVHLSHWGLVLVGGKEGPVNEQVRLEIGSLKTLAHVWPVAKTVLGQVKTVAEEMILLKKAMNPGYWGSYGGNDILREIEEDTGMVDFSPDGYGGLQPQ